jgi:uncharacterized membrane protein
LAKGFLDEGFTSAFGSGKLFNTQYYMRKFILFSGIFALFLAFFVAPVACAYDNEEDLFGQPTPCDTANIRYSVEIKTLLDTKCGKCHTEAVATDFSGIELGSYDALKGYADDGKLVDRTNDASSPMPPPSDGGLLPDCDRQKIKAWIAAGAKNN